MSKVDWPFIIGLVVALISLSFTVIALADDSMDFVVAKALFLLAGLVFAGRWIAWRARTKLGDKMDVVYVAVGCALVGVLAYGAIRYVDRKRDRRLGRAGSPVVAQSSAASSVEVYPPFQDAYDTYKGELGTAGAPAEKLVSVGYYAEYENAKVIWIPNYNKFAVIGFSEKRHKWKFNDDKWPDFSYVIEACNRKRFTPKPPNGRYPPYGGVAAGWEFRWNDWKGIGWRIEHYYYPDAHIQRFKNGYIVGMFRRDPKQDRIGQVAFVLLDNADWHSKVSFPTGDKENELKWLNPNEVDKRFNDPCTDKIVPVKIDMTARLEW